MFAPTHMGGSNTYLIINGNSMEPTYYTGDLVILRHSEAYGIGQEVAYEHPSIGIVYHSIIGFDGDLVILQGYNNDWEDEFRPKRDDLLGTYWRHVPQVGTYVQLRQFPKIIAVIIALSFLLALWPRESNRPKTIPLMNTESTTKEDWFSLFLVVTLIAGGLVWFAFRQPLTASQTNTISYEQKVAFRYSAMASETVYDAPLVSPGEPLFRQLVDSFTIGVNYKLDAFYASQLEGQYTLTVEIRDVNGWKRTITLVPPTVFEGESADVVSQLSFFELQEIIDRMESTTGVQRSVYHLYLKPEFLLTGFVEGHSINERYAPALRFELNDKELRLIDTSGANDQGLLQSQANSLAVPAVVPNTITLVGLNLPVTSVRQIAIAFLAMSALATVMAGYVAIQAGGAAEDSNPAHRNLFIDVEKPPTITTTATHVRYGSLADLIQTAYQSKQIILRQKHTGGVQYLVITDTVIYSHERALNNAVVTTSEHVVSESAEVKQAGNSL